MLLNICSLVAQYLVQFLISSDQGLLMAIKTIDLVSQVTTFTSSVIVECVLFTDLDDSSGVTFSECINLVNLAVRLCS